MWGGGSDAGLPSHAPSCPCPAPARMHTRTFVLAAFNGPNEGIATTIVALLYTAGAGSDLWRAAAADSLPRPIYAAMRPALDALRWLFPLSRGAPPPASPYTNLEVFAAFTLFVLVAGEEGKGVGKGRGLRSLHPRCACSSQARWPSASGRLQWRYAPAASPRPATSVPATTEARRTPARACLACAGSSLRRLLRGPWRCSSQLSSRGCTMTCCAQRSTLT